MSARIKEWQSPGKTARTRDPPSSKERTQESQSNAQSPITETDKPESIRNPTYGYENPEKKYRLVRRKSEYTEIDLSNVKDVSPEVNNMNKPEVAIESPTVDKAPPVIPKRAPVRPPVIPPRPQPLSANQYYMLRREENTAEENIDGETDYEVYEVVNIRASPQDGPRSAAESTRVPTQDESTKVMQAEAIPVTTKAISNRQTEEDEVKADGCAPRHIQKDEVIEKEVSSIKMQPWFFTFEERRKAKMTLMSKKDQDGSFVLVCENIRPSCVCHFILCVTKEGMLNIFQIRKVTELGNTRYRIISEKKRHRHLTDLLEYHMEHKLPYIGVKLVPWNQ